MTPAQLRAEAKDALLEPGAQRLELQRQLTEIDAVLRPLVARAVEVEVPYRTITDLTGVAPNTARAWKQATDQ